MTDAELITHLKQLIASWRAKYHTAENEKLVLLRQVRELRDALNTVYRLEADALRALYDHDLELIRIKLRLIEIECVYTDCGEEREGPMNKQDRQDLHNMLLDLCSEQDTMTFYGGANEPDLCEYARDSRDFVIEKIETFVARLVDCGQ